MCSTPTAGGLQEPTRHWGLTVLVDILFRMLFPLVEGWLPAGGGDAQCRVSLQHGKTPSRADVPSSYRASPEEWAFIPGLHLNHFLALRGRPCMPGDKVALCRAGGCAGAPAALCFQHHGCKQPRGRDSWLMPCGSYRGSGQGTRAPLIQRPTR